MKFNRRIVNRMRPYRPGLTGGRKLEGVTFECGHGAVLVYTPGRFDLTAVCTQCATGSTPRPLVDHSKGPDAVTFQLMQPVRERFFFKRNPLKNRWNDVEVLILKCGHIVNRRVRPGSLELVFCVGCKRMSTSFTEKLERGQERKARREQRQLKQMQRLHGVLKIKRKRRRHSDEES